MGEPRASTSPCCSTSCSNACPTASSPGAWSVRTGPGTAASACAEISSDLDVAVGGELFVPHAVDGETYPLEGHEIDLEQLVRDAVLLELPLAPTCASTGAPPCRAPSVNDDDDDAPVDPRWAALSELEL